MARIILHRQGVYNVYCTIADAPIFDHGLELEDLEEWVREEYGARALHYLPDRLKRAHIFGTSSFDGATLAELIFDNRAGQKERTLQFEAFVKKFMTLPPVQWDELERPPGYWAHPECLQNALSTSSAKRRTSRKRRGYFVFEASDR